ncbi:WbqC family protein [Nocardiopsis ganjiahuensis]|uniref:WbqC family protein n=1 Tax=Nocardiopsis ganjiahuensis TaxID=239984 RepID=UPI000347638F|nr:WbqC family protein [Nocardiopsis ganjiahuensis]
MIGDSRSPSPDPAHDTSESDHRRAASTSHDSARVRAAVHQPHYWPWLGLIDKIDRSDRFIMLDTVQFERRGWQNRNYVAGPGKPVLLTVPVTQASRDERIRDKKIDNTQKWSKKHYRALAEHCYRKAPYWVDYREEIAQLYETEWEDLADLAIATTRLLTRGFGIDTPILRASELGDFPGHKSELLAQICAKAGADTMLSGDGARDYLDPEIMHRHGVDIEWQGFNHPVYQQHTRGPADEFVPRLSAIDLLLNAGPDALHVLRQARSRD